MKRTQTQTSSGMAIRSLCVLASLLVLPSFLVGCRELDPRQIEFGIPAGDRPHHEFNFQNMWDSPAIEAQELGMRQPAAGTLPVEGRTYPPEALNDINKAGELLANPVPLTQGNLAQGRVLYDTYCGVCHGERGLGNGPVGTHPAYPIRPPSLASRKLRTYKDGQIYHIITHGQNNMGHYRSQIRPMERWAIVHYIRALQRAEYPKERDVKRWETAAKASPELSGPPPAPKTP